ncbi:STY0301 family protein [Roseateles chitosanitabidus]|uniref:STY0301 family protein n=1 Tax=Roseateles chitosanitabidus TaxID=65048 RepID=UPI0011DFDFD3|nr:STY0301 family protein [Roseateles chitosanitabidus]MBO9685448.1 hypothetical protein [Roseateles chitosanitabidus]
MSTLLHAARRRAMGGAVLAALGLSAGVAMAAPEPFSCPAQIAGTAQTAQDVPAGWQSVVDQPVAVHVLQGFRINLGPLDTADGDVPDDTVEKGDGKGGKRETTTWKLAGKRGAYAVCQYAATKLVLARPLDGYTQCTLVNHRRREGVYRLESAGCQ